MNKGLGSLKPPGLVQLCSDQPPLEIWLALSGLLSCVASALTTAQLRPGLAAPGAQTPRAISAPELLIFLNRLAALTAMKFFWGTREKFWSALQQRRTWRWCVLQSTPFWPERGLSRQRKVLADKPEFVSGSHMVEGENGLPKLSSDPHTEATARACPLDPPLYTCHYLFIC